MSDLVDDLRIRARDEGHVIYERAAEEITRLREALKSAATALSYASEMLLAAGNEFDAQNLERSANEIRTLLATEKEAG